MQLTTLEQACQARAMPKSIKAHIFWNNLISENKPTSIDPPGADSTVAMSSVAISNNKFQKKGESWRYHPEREPDRGQNKRKCEGWIDKEDNQCGHCGEMGHFPAYCPRMA
jgi:hypothetical protein